MISTVWVAFICTKAKLAAFLNLQFVFVFFCQNNICVKAIRKMLVKLTTMEGEDLFLNPRYRIVGSLSSSSVLKGIMARKN